MTRNDLPNGRGEAWVAAQAILLAAIVLTPPNLFGMPRLPDWLRLPGLLLGFTGGAFGLMAIRHLGSNLTAFPRPKDDATLVDSGAYSIVRHPIYSSLLMACTGFSLLRISLPSLVLSLILGFFFEQKARREERWLKAKFAAYANYIQRVPGRILPMPRMKD